MRPASIFLIIQLSNSRGDAGRIRRICGKRLISKRIFIYAFGFRWYNVHTDYMIEGVFWYGTYNYSGDI